MCRSGSILLLAVILSTWPAASGPAQGLNLENQVVEHTLGNGLKLLMVQRHEVPRVVCHLYSDLLTWVENIAIFRRFSAL